MRNTERFPTGKGSVSLCKNIAAIVHCHKEKEWGLLGEAGVIALQAASHAFHRGKGEDRAGKIAPAGATSQPHSGAKNRAGVWWKPLKNGCFFC